MRIIVTLLLAVCCTLCAQVRIPGPGGATASAPAPAYITSSYSAIEGLALGGVADTPAATTVGASLVVLHVVCAGYVNATSATVTDTQGNTYHSVSNSGQEPTVATWYSYDHGGSPFVGNGSAQTHVDCHNAGYGGDLSIAKVAFSGTRTASDPVGVHSGSVCCGTNTVQPGSLTPAIGDLVVSGFDFGAEYAGTCTVTAPFTQPGCTYTASTSGTGMSLAYYLAPSTSSLNPTWTSNGFYLLSYITSFKPAP